MKISELPIKGAYLIELEKFEDNRGTFARQFCKNELKEYGIDFDIKQCNLSQNFRAGVLRGLHYQKDPYPEIKIVSCPRGKIYDVIADIRPDSPTYLKWVATELSEDNGKMIYIPPNVVHGFQTEVDNSCVYYQLGEFFMPDYYDGVRWNDPKLNIIWPPPPPYGRIINERDNKYKNLK